MKMYSPKSIIFPEGMNMILVGEYIFIFPVPACYKCFIIPNETRKTQKSEHVITQDTNHIP
jgi:hypothetical protein